MQRKAGSWRSLRIHHHAPQCQKFLEFESLSVGAARADGSSDRDLWGGLRRSAARQLVLGAGELAEGTQEHLQLRSTLTESDPPWSLHVLTLFNLYDSLVCSFSFRCCHGPSWPSPPRKLEMPWWRSEALSGMTLAMIRHMTCENTTLRHVERHGWHKTNHSACKCIQPYQDNFHEKHAINVRPRWCKHTGTSLVSCKYSKTKGSYHRRKLRSRMSDSWKDAAGQSGRTRKAQKRRSSEEKTIRREEDPEERRSKRAKCRETFRFSSVSWLWGFER